MISQLRGQVLDGTTIMTGCGVGYKVVCVAPLEENSVVDLYIHSVHRDTAVTLYAFLTKADLAIFAELLRAPGVGAATAMNIVSTLGVAGTQQAFEERDLVTLCGVPGIGKKSAQKLLASVDLGRLDVEDSSVPAGASNAVQTHVRQALVALGYKNVEVKAALERVDPRLDEPGALQAAMEYLQTGK